MSYLSFDSDALTLEYLFGINHFIIRISVTNFVFIIILERVEWMKKYRFNFDLCPWSFFNYFSTGFGLPPSNSIRFSEIRAGFLTDTGDFLRTCFKGRIIYIHTYGLGRQCDRAEGDKIK